MNIITFGAMILLLVTSYAQAGASTNSLIIGASQEPPNIMDPWATNNLGIATEINGFMTASLVYHDNKGDLHPDIAKRVPTQANGGYRFHKNAKGKIISNSVTYDIRPEAKWSDGQDITSHDFAFWLQVTKDKKVPVPRRIPWKNAKIKIDNERRFTITYKPPYLFADVISPHLAPKHIFEKGYQKFTQITSTMNSTSAKDAQRINRAWKKFISKHTTSVHTPRVASGPFKPSSWRPSNNFMMVRNPHYWRQPIGGSEKYVQSIQYMFITDTNTLKINLLSRRIDALSAVGLTLDQALDLEKTKNRKFAVKHFAAGFVEQIAIPYTGTRAREMGLNDKRVRQALLYSLDRKKINQALFKGKQPPAHTWINSASKLLQTDTKKYKYDPQKAKRLLHSAGWKPGPDGILQKNGKKMILKLTTTAGNKIRKRVELILKNQWEQVGIKIKIQNYPASVLFSNDFIKRGDEGKWDLLMFAWPSNSLTEDGVLWISQEAPTKTNGFTGSNYPKYQSKAYDALWKKASIEFNPRKRVALFDKMQKIWTEDLPVLPLYHRISNYARSSELVNYDYSPHSHNSSWNAYKIGWKSKGAIADKDAH